MVRKVPFFQWLYIVKKRKVLQSITAFDLVALAQTLSGLQMTTNSVSATLYAFHSAIARIIVNLL